MENAKIQDLKPMRYQGKQVEKKDAFFFCCWILQIGVWATLIVTIIFIVKDKKQKKGLIVILIIVYLLYLLFEFLSSDAKYLLNKNSNQGIYEEMKRYFSTPPVIKIHFQCYKYLYKAKTSISGSSIEKEKVIEHDEDYTFPYYSARDVSGLFYLNCEKAYAKKKKFIKLELIEDINFADNISVMDYENKKNAILRQLKLRYPDDSINVEQKRKIPDMIHHNLIKMSEEIPASVNYGLFVIFTILTLAEFYKIYFNTFCIYQKFYVRKIVSTRYNLNQQTYEQFVPQINIFIQQFKFEPNIYNYVDESNKVDYPTQEELEGAKQYNKYVPIFKCSKGDENVPDGVVQSDEPAPLPSGFQGNDVPSPHPANMNGFLDKNNLEKGYSQNNIREVEDDVASKQTTIRGLNPKE
jgi:hypothetical protein